MIRHHVIIGVALAIMLGGCAEKRMDDLRRFVDTAHKDRKPRVEPLPRIRPHESFTYTATNLSDPFAASNLGRRKPATDSGLSPDLNRRKEPLEQFPLDALTMVGTLRRAALAWAIVRAPDGTVHRIAEGNYLGQNFGQVKKVSEEKLDITELVQNANGSWVERLANLAIVE
ncbi:MAG: pilus assembly protein PilP [Gammaproteobacteria bacterium]|nr:pilus assembly protein PilP [Gammaproteobacteria bacterium]